MSLRGVSLPYGKQQRGNLVANTTNALAAMQNDEIATLRSQ